MKAVCSYFRAMTSCRRYLLFISISVALYICYFVQDIRYCDQTELNKQVEMPSGKKIPYYTGSSAVKKYKELAGVDCKYDGNGTVQCPDVRMQGESLNRQGLLVIARLHAIFDLICRRHNVDYFVFAGSLLGSQRDGLLIPWDFDSDIGIMMEDFLELLKYIRRDLPPDIYFEDGVDNPTFKKFCEARLRDRNSCYGHCLRTGCERNDGIQIDIFAFRRSKETPGLIENHYYKEHKLKYDDIYPTTEVLLEGTSLRAPRNIKGLNTEMFGANHMTKPIEDRHQCHKNGYTSIPWYSCEALEAMPEKKRIKILGTSMGHRSIFFWYFG